ncbi:LytTR family DNA-binding domain-containing protein [Streptococcus panodentis]|uniref:LytTR family transcriptional regulator n=1 Tax=Streptococcus panodentis TaxID=1581472 RepID=A0ABS5AUV5_9STRE|nr:MULTISPECIES: LytTR family DNA-binding domain-containing protein [Streptococcus]KXT84138.1 BlpS protein [Streptococcus sp. DD11]MBP2620354.1 LytTR family transcriptional regulator [Streptococcus panodentis]
MTTIVIKDGGTYRKLNLSAIFYIQSHPQKPHFVLIVTGKGDFELRASLAELKETYPDSLLHCNRQTLVNLAKIKGINRQAKSILFDKKGLPDLVCSRRHFASLLRRWSKEGGK